MEKQYATEFLPILTRFRALPPNVVQYEMSLLHATAAERGINLLGSGTAQNAGNVTTIKRSDVRSTATTGRKRGRKPKSQQATGTNNQSEIVGKTG